MITNGTVIFYVIFFSLLAFVLGMIAGLELVKWYWRKKKGLAVPRKAYIIRE